MTEPRIKTQHDGIEKKKKIVSLIIVETPQSFQLADDLDQRKGSFTA